MMRHFPFCWKRVYILLSLCLAGCASGLPQHPIPKLEEATYDAHQGIVIIKTFSVYMKEEYRVTTRWALYDDNYKTPNQKTYTFETEFVKDWKKYVPGYVMTRVTLRFSQAVGYDAYQLPPGRYILDYIECTLNNKTFQTPEKDGWDKTKDAPKWGEFYVHEGEVLYLGDLEFHFDKENVGIIAYDEQKHAEEFMKVDYPWFQGKMTWKRPKIPWAKQYHNAEKYVGPPPDKDGVYR